MASKVKPAMASRMEMWPIEKLVPYEKNARTHSPEQVAQLSASIVEFGFVNPILVDTEAGVIAGHGRLAAAKDLGLDEVPVVVLDHLTPTQRKAYIIADNQLAQNAGWDMSLLQQEVVGLQLQDFDLGLLGFDEDTLQEITDFLDDDPTGEGEREFEDRDGPQTEEEEAEEEDRSNDDLRPMRHLTWDEFDEAVYRLANAYEGRAFNGVYGFPRGGLCLAVALSHYLDLPLLDEIKDDCLVVDDVYETGVTLSQALTYEGVECAVWISKAEPTWFRAVEVANTDEWLLFPWENPAKASADEDAYRASRE
jgi:hypothetical protein